MSHEFRGLCDRHGIEQSSGRTGSCLDNAVAESLWASLKRELVSRCRFASRAEAASGHHHLDQPLQRGAPASFARRNPAHRVGTAPLPLDGHDQRLGGVKPYAQIAAEARKATGSHQPPGTSRPSRRTINPTSTCPADGGRPTELRVSVTDQELDTSDLFSELCAEVTSLLGYPVGGRLSRHASDPHEARCRGG